VTGTEPVARQGAVQDWAAALAWPIASFAAMLIAWELLVPVLGIPSYILPVPSEILVKAWNDRAL